MTPDRRVAILLSGTGTNCAALLYASRLPDSGFTIVAAGSNLPNAGGLALAAAEGVPTFAIDHRGMARADHDAAMVAALRDHAPDVVALAGYMRIVGAPFLEAFPGRIVNIHPSLLPAYRGLETHARALSDGVSYGGCSVHLVTEELDGGPLLGQARVAIRPGDTPDSLAERVRIAEHQLYPYVLRRFCASL